MTPNKPKGKADTSSIGKTETWVLQACSNRKNKKIKIKIKNHADRRKQVKKPSGSKEP